MICRLQGTYFPHTQEKHTLISLIKQEKEMYKVLNCETFSCCKRVVVSVSIFSCFPETAWHDLPQYLQYPSHLNYFF